MFSFDSVLVRQQSGSGWLVCLLRVDSSEAARLCEECIILTCNTNLVDHSNTLTDTSPCALLVAPAIYRQRLHTQRSIRAHWARRKGSAPVRAARAARLDKHTFEHTLDLLTRLVDRGLCEPPKLAAVHRCLHFSHQGLKLAAGRKVVVGFRCAEPRAERAHLFRDCARREVHRAGGRSLPSAVYVCGGSKHVFANVDAQRHKRRRRWRLNDRDCPRGRASHHFVLATLAPRDLNGIAVRDALVNLQQFSGCDVYGGGKQPAESGERSPAVD
jgi:hypothetical protein